MSIEAIGSAMARVFRYRIFKPAPVIEIVRKRGQTLVLISFNQGAETGAEKSLEELDPTLAEVFPKAA